MLPINIYEVFSHMKLWNAIFLFSLFCIVLLSACTNSNEVNTNSSSDIPEPTTQIESTDSGTSAPLEMTMALPSTGIFSTEISGNQDGAYYILPNTNDYSAQLLYYDYATLQLIYLSDQVVVTNNDENPGWIEDIFGGAVPLAVNEKLYIIKYGKSPIPNINYDGSPTFLLQMEPNAANRIKLSVPQGSLLPYSSGIAADGSNLYLLLLDYDSQKMQITNTTLCCTDFNKNKMNRLCSLGNQKDWSIIGTYSEGLILQCSWLSSEHSSQDSDDQLSNLHYELQLYSLHDNCLIDTNFTWKQGELSLVINQDIIYYVKKGDLRLYAHSLQTGKDLVVSDNLYGSDSSDSSGSVMLVGEIHDNNIVFSNLNEQYFCYNLATKKTMPLLLSYEYDGGTIPVSIMAENEQYFLVNTGIVTLSRSATGTDGSIYNIDYPITDYKLIKKEDYWNSVPNYLSFDITQLQSNNQF